MVRDRALNTESRGYTTVGELVHLYPYKKVCVCWGGGGKAFSHAEGGRAHKVVV